MLNDGAEFAWEYVDPALLLDRVLHECPRLTEVYRQVADSMHPGDLWHMVVAFDEYVPGNKLKLDNGKKVMNLAYNFINLGSEVMACENSWMIAISVRHSIITKCKGGWPHMLCVFLKRLLQQFCVEGVPLVLGGEPYKLRCKMTDLLSGGDGLRQALA